MADLKPGSVFAPPYSYIPEAATAVEADVRANAEPKRQAVVAPFAKGRRILGKVFQSRRVTWLSLWEAGRSAIDSDPAGYLDQDFQVDSEAADCLKRTFRSAPLAAQSWPIQAGPFARFGLGLKDQGSETLSAYVLSVLTSVPSGPRMSILTCGCPLACVEQLRHGS